jgi:hypothetical protein
MLRLRCYPLFLILLLILLPLRLQAASALQSSEDAPQVILGQFIRAEAAQGDELTYRLPLEGGGTYVLSSGDADETQKFTFILTDENEQEVTSGPLTDTELKLEPGDYTLSFTASEDAQLSAVVVGDYGSLSDDSSNPGDLFNGSYVTLENVEAPHYARLSIPEFDYYQLVFLNVQGGQDDDYSIEVTGNDVYKQESLSSGNPIQFWSKGGQYDLTITPLTGGESLFVMVLLSGPAPALAQGEEVSGTLSGDGDAKFYTFDVSQAGALVTVQMTPADDEVDFDLSASINPENSAWQNSSFSGAETLEFMAPHAGNYFVKVTSSTGQGDFTIQAQEGDLATEMLPNHQMWDITKSGAINIYRMQVDDPGQLLSLILVGGAGDLDLRATLYDEAGSTVHYLSALSSGSAEIVSQTDAQPGLYEITVDNRYGDLDSLFSLTARLESPLAFSGQWAVEAEASSQYQDEGYAPAQAAGEPNTPSAGDYNTAWASKEADAGEETLTLTYEYPVMPAALNIYETYNPGAVIKIEAYQAAGNEWVVLWEGEAAPSDTPIRIFSPEFEPADFATNQIRLTLDSAAVSGWNEIDAVELVGLPE